MTELKTLESKVEKILRTNEETKSDDFVLWLKICEWEQVDVSLPFWYLVKNHNEFGLPSFEGVRRTRQKLQAKHPELKNKEAAQHRADRENDYYEYARS